MASITISEGQYKRLFKQPKDIIISEDQYNRVFSLLNEDRESKNMKKARNVVRAFDPNMDAQKLITAIRNDIPNSRLNQCQFLPGVTRMYLSGQIKDGQAISNLNSTLKLLTQAHANEYDNNLNGMSCKELIDKFATAVTDDINAAKSANAKRQFIKNNDYQIVRIPDYKTAEKYGNYTDWCITHFPDMYDNYTHDGLGVFYFLLKNGFEQVKEVAGEGCPLDEYGLSMVAVSIDENGALNTVTCRWNHSNGGNDNIMTDEQLSNLIGQDVYQVLKPRDVQVINETERFKVCELDGKRYIYDKKMKEHLNVDKDGCATFRKDYHSHFSGKVNEIGEIIIEPRFFYIGEFESDGYAICLVYDKGLINKKGEQLFDTGPKGNVTQLTKANKYGVRYIEKFYNGKTYKEYTNVNTGKSINNEDFRDVCQMDVDGRFLAIGHDGKGYLIDGDLSYALDPNLYDDCDVASEVNWSRVIYKNDLMGLIDKDCNIVLQPIYNFISDDDIERDEHYNVTEARRVRLQTENGKRRGIFRLSKMTIEWEDGEVERVGNINESITYTPNGTKAKPSVDMHIGTDLDDSNNLASNNVDTRAFGYKCDMTDFTSDGSTTGKEKYLILTMINQMYKSAINYARYKGKRRLKLPTDEECNANGQLRNIQTGIVKKTRNNIQKKVNEYSANGDFQGLITWCERKMSDRALQDEINTNLYNRANDFKRNIFKKYGTMIPRYNVGTVPNTNVKVIALFTMSDFNFSDAIKHGEIRPNTNAKNVLGFDTKNNIPVTYDGGIPANIENNFSTPEVNTQDHFKRQFGYNDKNYTSVTRFIDKSIMYAAYALNKENYHPQYIIAAPSSSKFNHYYSQNLSNKLGTAEYVPDFFQRNLINFTTKDGEIISEKMRNDGIPENLIIEFQRTMEGVALGEIADEIAKPIRKLISDNYQDVAAISAKHYSREKVNVDILTRLILNYSYKIVLKVMQQQNHIEISNVSKYLVDVFMKDDTHLYNNDLYLVNEFRNRIKLKFGKKAFGQVIMQMYNTVIKYGSDLENGNGYKIKFNKPFKITKLSKFIRPYLTEMYVVADKNFNENHELFTRYANGKFLIVDEDLNSGATLANVIHALQNVMPTQKQNNIMCLTNAYSSGGR